MTDLTLLAGAHAFGDGSHPTTRGMLEVIAGLDAVVFTPHRAIDIGAGSGILSFAIVGKFRCHVIAVDIMRSAIDMIEENAHTNGYAGYVRALQADGFDHPEIAARAPYDLITMNILAEPLLKLASEAAAYLAPEGVLILSGILLWQETQIREACSALGLALSARVVIGDWATLVWQKPAE
jgi:ribosomal protein L11 methyltransferase